MEWIAKQMLRDVRKCEYFGRVARRTDGDPAISSREGGQRSVEESESSMPERDKRRAEDQFQEEVEARRMRSTEGGDELPIPEASSSVAPNADGEVSMRSLLEEAARILEQPSVATTGRHGGGKR